MENDLKAISFAFCSSVYNYAAQLSVDGHMALADKLLDNALETRFASVFASSSFSKEGFINQLKQGYFAAGRVVELLTLIKAMGIECEDHDRIADEADKIVRMLAASINTVQRNSQTAPQRYKQPSERYTSTKKETSSEAIQPEVTAEEALEAGISEADFSEAESA